MNEDLKKITKTTLIADYEVLTDSGFVDIVSLHETISYTVFHLKLSDGNELKCADNHIVFYMDGMEEVYVKNLSIGDKICVNADNKLTEAEVIEITNLGYEEVMYDLELAENTDHRYYTNEILSHNTLLARSLAELLFGDAKKIIRMDMSEYMERHTVSKIIGSPSGYVGYENGGLLTESVKNNPFSIILLDEIEKAHPDVHNIFLQIMEEGRLTDSFGLTADFTNTLIIMTSNVGARQVSEFGSGIGFNTASSENQKNELKIGVIKKELKKRFNPEFINRIDEVINFNDLNDDSLKTIINLELTKLNNRLALKNYFITFDQTILDEIKKRNVEEGYGARPLRRIIQNLCEDFLNEEILKGHIKENVPVTLTFTNEEIKIF